MSADPDLLRYGFLCGYAPRTDAEEAEMVTLRESLQATGSHPGWEEVPRRTDPLTEAEMAPFLTKPAPQLQRMPLP